LAGFSTNSSSISATGVAAIPTGLPPGTGWWLSMGPEMFNSSTNASLSLFLPEGTYPYEIGPDSYSFVASQPFGNLTVAGTPLQFTATFAPRYAILEGTVDPAGANITVNGSAISVLRGSFFEPLVAGTYSFKVATPGYQTNTSSITLTPGNTTTVTVLLQRDPTPPGSSSGTSASNGTLIVEGSIVVAAIAIAAVFGAMMNSKKKGAGSQPRTGAKDPPAQDPPRAA
jgi:PEGA domain